MVHYCISRTNLNCICQHQIVTFLSWEKVCFQLSQAKNFNFYQTMHGFCEELASKQNIILADKVNDDQ